MELPVSYFTNCTDWICCTEMDPKEEKENSASKAEASESEHIKELPLELLDPSADSASAGDSTGVEDMQADASKDKLQNVGETDDNLETSKTEIPVENNETKCEKETGKILFSF